MDDPGAADDFSFLDGFEARPQGHSIQVRLYAEDPSRDFRPSSGRLIEVAFPQGDRSTLRVDSWVESGSEVPAWYDPMLAKLIVTAPTRRKPWPRCRPRSMRRVLPGSRPICAGCALWCAARLRERGGIDPRARRFAWQPRAIRVVTAGAATTVQDYPRVGLWDVVPPSGPMDALSFRLGNRVLGNPESAAGLEITAAGPTLEFWLTRGSALPGRMRATLDGVAVPRWQPVAVAAGQVLRIGRVQGPGCGPF
jgi:urea carboxylase